LHFQNAAGELFYHPSGYVRLAWSAERLSLAELQAIYDQALQLMRDKDTGKLLSEHGQRAPLVAAAQAWLTGDWIPRAVAQVGLRYCAIVEGQNPLHRLSTHSVVTATRDEVVFRQFATVQEAHAWLISLD